MSSKDISVVQATKVLVARDPVLAELWTRHGPVDWSNWPGNETLDATDAGLALYEALVRSIVYQQLAGKAAATIHGRLASGLDGVTPEAILVAGEDRLRGFGLSRAKAISLMDLAARTADGSLRLGELAEMQDHEVLDELVVVKGIGPWTAQMIMIFHLHRLDVWPTGDLAVRAGFAHAWSLPGTPTAKELEVLGNPHRPYRSIVAWYCWRACEDRRLQASGQSRGRAAKADADTARAEATGADSLTK